jgi:hypothetical protein
VPATKPAVHRTPRRPIELNPERLAEFPTHAGAAIVRRALERLGAASAVDLGKEIAAECAAIDIAFPAAMVSRLKQAGFLREVAAS